MVPVTYNGARHVQYWWPAESLSESAGLPSLPIVCLFSLIIGRPFVALSVFPSTTICLLTQQSICPSIPVSSVTDPGPGRVSRSVYYFHD